MIKTILEIGESYTCPLKSEKLAHVWLTQSTQRMKIVV